jgi:hypothetical protein
MRIYVDSIYINMREENQKRKETEEMDVTPPEQ